MVYFCMIFILLFFQNHDINVNIYCLWNYIDFLQAFGSLLMIYGSALPPSGSVWSYIFKRV